MKNRYALITVDTEAQPGRASQDHVKRLIWGAHEKGTAGIREMCNVADEFRVKLVFFVDACGIYLLGEEFIEATRWLDQQGHDVQLHTHSELLPKAFWLEHGFRPLPRFLNQYNDEKSFFVIKYFSQLLSEIIGKPINAFRAGSFRWNAASIRALTATNIPLSFNNSMRSYLSKHCSFSEPYNLPYVWSNGVIEVPVTEKKIPSLLGENETWKSLTYPESSYFKLWSSPAFFGLNFFKLPQFCVFLMHSWSLLYWDENGYGAYQDDKRLEGYRRLLKKITKDYDVITTRDFLDLYARGKITATHEVDVKMAEQN